MDISSIDNIILKDIHKPIEKNIIKSIENKIKTESRKRKRKRTKTVRTVLYISDSSEDEL